MPIFEISSLNGCLYSQGAYTCGVLLLVIILYKIVGRSLVLADVYTTGMTVVLMGFALEPLDCLLYTMNL